MKLSILIPTLPERAQKLRRLQNILMPQCINRQVEVIYHDAGRSMSIGQKRNMMVSMAHGEYFVFIDDDDHIERDYVSSIMKALESNPDCVTFEGWMTTNGKARVDWVIKLGERYEERGGKYYRWPNHLVPMKRDLVKHVRFPDVKQGEDYSWSKQIHDMKLLKTSVHIEKKLYWYDFQTNK